MALCSNSSQTPRSFSSSHRNIILIFTTAFIYIYLPAVRDGDDAGAVLGDLEEHGHGKVEVGTRRVTPSAIVVRECEIRRAEVSGGDEDGGAAGMAPPRVLVAFNFKASTAAKPVVEQRRAKRRRVHSVSLAVQVSISTSTSCKSQKHKCTSEAEYRSSF